MTAVYIATAALLVLSVAAIRYQRLSVSVPAIIMALATAGWCTARAIRGPEDLQPSLLVAVGAVLVQVSAAAFYVTCRRLVAGRWFIRAWHWIIAISFGTLTFIGMLPRVGITDGDRYYDSPVFVAHLVYGLALLGAGVLTLSQRQHDPSRHVRHFVVMAETAALLLVTSQVVAPTLTPVAAAALSLLMAWSTSRTVDWSRSASRAGQLLDSIGVFIFVVDRDGVLHDWNGPAGSLLELRGETAAHGLDLGAALGHSEPFTDGAVVSIDARGGLLRTSVSVHEVDPLARNSDRVLMFRPVRSTVETSSFPRVSGALKGHDPATQTLCRKAALEVLRAAADAGTPIVRLVVTPRDQRRADEAMFLIARRMEARSAEHGFPDVEWARLDTWTFVTALLDPSFFDEPANVLVDDLQIDLEVTFHTPIPGESADSLIRRVSEGHGRDTAQGS